MNNREKTLTTFLAVAVLGMIALIGAIMAKEQDIKRYKNNSRHSMPKDVQSNIL